MNQPRPTSGQVTLSVYSESGIFAAASFSMFSAKQKLQPGDALNEYVN